MIWGGRYIKFIVGLNPTGLDSSVVRASGIYPEGLGSIPSLVTFLYSNNLCIIGRFLCFPGAVRSYYFQDPLPNSKYGRYGYVK